MRPLEAIIPDKCSRCSDWTATRLMHDDGLCTMTCTVCGASVTSKLSRQKANKLVKGARVFAKLQLT